MGAVWGDIDNDGREDVLVYRYGYLALFRNVDGRRFEDVTARAGLRRWVNSNGAIWLDYDRDGLLDLYVTAYFRDVDLWHLTTTRIMHNSFEFATNGGKNLLFHNLGDGRSRTSPTGWASAARGGRWPPPRPTSTATGGRTSISPTTMGPRSCTSTTAAGDSR